MIDGDSSRCVLVKGYAQQLQMEMGPGAGGGGEICLEGRLRSLCLVCQLCHSLEVGVKEESNFILEYSLE